MKKSLFFICLIVLSLSLVVAGCGGQENPADVQTPADATEPNETDTDEVTLDMQPTVWTLVDYSDPATSHYKQKAAMCDAIYERTNGLLDIQIYCVTEFPFTINDMLSVVADRTVEMTAPSFSYVSGESPITGMTEWPMLCPSNEEMQTTIDILEPWLTAEYDAMGVELLGWWSCVGHGFYGVGSTPQSLADFNGLKIRLFNVAITNFMVQYNVVPVTLALSETIPSLQRNVIDGALTGCVYAYDSSWYDVIDWAFFMNVLGAANAIYVNSAAMNELPAEVQAIVREEVDNYHKVNIEYNETYTQACRDGMAENGVDVVYCTDEEYELAEEKAVEVWESLAANAGSDCVEALAAVRAALGK